MLVKVKTVKGVTEFFETNDYGVSKTNVHPDLIEIQIFNNRGKRLYHWKRPHAKFYIKYEYKPLPEENKK